MLLGMNWEKTLAAGRRRTARALLAVSLAVGGPLPAGAQDSRLAQPVAPPSAEHPLAELFSGYRYQSVPVRRMQDHDIRNPGMLWYDYGAKLWSLADGEAGKSCADCHNVAEKAMRGVGARYPVFDAAEGKLLSLEQRINLCRTLNMKAPPWDWGSDELVAMTAYVRAQSRGMPVRVKIDGQAAALFEAGKAYYDRRRGQLNLSCAGCHQFSAGKKLRATTLSQGQSNGFPAYRISAERAVSLHQQFQQCNRRVRAAPLALGSDAYVNLELYLAWRGGGLAVETPAVRN